MRKIPVFLITLFAWLVLQPLHPAGARPAFLSGTPTYDPLEEPRLPPDPSEYELGRNLYWHWCMTCHGDRGQGLTDEFRAIWEPEHQDCWGRGCHAGRPGDEGFPIPTVVPALVDDHHLAQFPTVQKLSDYLPSTHPPQSPGILEEEEYHSIAVFIFTMNDRAFGGTPAPASTDVSAPLRDSTSIRLPVYALVVLTLLGAAGFALARKNHPGT